MPPPHDPGDERGGSRTPRRLLYGCELTIRLSPAERKELRQRARTAGLSLSRYLVESALQGTPPALSAEERAQRQRAIFHARKIGVNLNQIAHRLNAAEPVAAGELAAALRAATGALRRLAGRGGASGEAAVS
jgi:sugar phosphate isomerase/epimerase